MAYRRRIIDDLLDELFPQLTAISLEGAKGVGKTATGVERAASVLSLNDQNQQAIATADPDLITRLPSPVLIDEWQLVPTTWDRVRRAVDDDKTGGRFLLAGSAGVAPAIPIHTGAGRIVSFRMRPLAFSERDLVNPTVSLASLLNKDTPQVVGESPVDLPAYVEEILRSGFPGIRHLGSSARDIQLDSYLTRIVERELPENGMQVKRPNALMAWLTAYGAATATDAKYSTILDAATPGDDDKPARQTTSLYREHLQRIFVLDPLPAWVPTFNPLKQLTNAPKHHLVDPALAARLVGIGKDGLLRGADNRPFGATGSWLGALFESLAAQSVRVYAEAARAKVGHLRTKNGRQEIDMIVEGTDRNVVALEVKLTQTADDHAVRHLNWLKDQIGDRLVDRVVVTTGKYAYRRPDGVAVVPLALLGP